MASTDEAAALRQSRISPRDSETVKSPKVTATGDTPWRTLHQLANLPRTPSRRATSAGPLSLPRSNRRTPITRTPGVSQELNSARRTKAITPHGRAAQRGVDLRRAGLTPGKDRRRSGRQHRETPRDTLRALSRLLGPKSEVTVPTPQGPDTLKSRIPTLIQDDWEDEPGLERPRLSLPLDDQDEDDSLLLPPQSTLLYEDNLTIQSVELGRRAQSERPVSRISRDSFGDYRGSDAFADPQDWGSSRLGDGHDSTFLLGGAVRDDPGVFLEGDENLLLGEATGVLTDVELGARRPSLLTMQVDDPESTFVFNVPSRMNSEEIQPTYDDDESLAIEEDLNEDDILPIDLYPTVQTMDEMTGTTRDPLLTEEAQATSPLKQNHTFPPRGQEIDRQRTKKRSMLLSKHGIQYPMLPIGIVKKLSSSFAGTAANSRLKISKETMNAIVKASNWFFEQISDDLSAYSEHAGRKTIDESDVITLMTRQRQTNATTTPFSLAQRYLPRELLQELRMDP